MSDSVAFTIALPDNYRAADVLAFHGRDPLQLAEAVTADGLRKGLVWKGMPACLHLTFNAGHAHGKLSADGQLSQCDRDTAEALTRRMLGLTQPVEAFEDTFRHHPQIGRLVTFNPGLRLPVAASPFEALSWAITGQQISVAAAVSIRRRVIEAAGIRHSSGLLCTPDASAILGLSEERMRAAGFSLGKAKALREVSRRIVDGRLPLDGAPVADIGRLLLDAPGIGPWTVSYTLLRGFGWLDGSLHGDVAVRRGLQALLDLPDKPAEKEAERWLAPFSPWRALIAAHLWAWQAAKTAY